MPAHTPAVRKRVQIVLAVVVVAVVGVIVWQVLREREPVYQGKRLSQWAKIYASPDFTLLSHSMSKHAIEQMGTNAMPILLKMLQARDSAFTRKLGSLANNQSIIPVHFTSAAEYRFRAVAALKVLGPAAKSAVPALVTALNDDDFFVKSTSQDALEQIDPEAAARAGVK
jgi:hypothetical protein